MDIGLPASSSGWASEHVCFYGPARVLYLVQSAVEVAGIGGAACVLFRFLRAREWNVAKSFALLIETIKFRRESKPERLKPKEVSKANETGIMYRRGFDKFGHPILYVRYPPLPLSCQRSPGCAGSNR